MKPVTAAETEAHQRDGNPLLHVLPEESFARARVPGSLQACVYEVGFVDAVRALVPDLDTPLIVYGAGQPSLDSEVAAEKLCRAGYLRIADFRGGLAEWQATGRVIESDGNLEASPEPHGMYAADVATSVIRWTGRNLFNHHHGTLRLASGELEIDQGRLRGGRLVIDMHSIQCEDITDPGMNAMLIRHLKDDDFFAVDRFPTAVCTIENVDPVAAATPGTPNFWVSGELEIRDQRRPIRFPAVLAAADADAVTGQATLDFDRTEFGSLYGSGRLFASLGRHVVNDQVHLFLKIHARRA